MSQAQVMKILKRAKKPLTVKEIHARGGGSIVSIRHALRRMEVFGEVKSRRKINSLEKVWWV